MPALTKGAATPTASGRVLPDSGESKGPGDVAAEIQIAILQP